MTRARRRRRSGGFAPVTAMLEATAVVTWFVVLVLGERLIHEAGYARRAAERGAVEPAATLAQGPCTGPGASGPRGPLGAVSTRGAPMPSLGGPIDVAAHLGLRGVGAFAVYAQRPKNVTAEAESDTVRGHAILGASTHRFSAKRTRACRDDSLDKPASSIATYRDTVFGRHLRGY